MQSGLRRKKEKAGPGCALLRHSTRLELEAAAEVRYSLTYLQWLPPQPLPVLSDSWP